MAEPLPARSIDLDGALAIASKIPGWMRKPAGAFTYYLAAKLVKAGQPIAEIGVRRGKYLSILMSASVDSKVVGYDIFPFDQEPKIIKDFKAAFGNIDRLKLIKADSTALTPERIIEDCGGRPAFVSIDGSHEAGPVESDLVLCTKVLADGGFAACDDFLNPYAIGVNEAFYRYQLLWQGENKLVPFAFIANKLFVATEAYADSYGKVAHEFVTTHINKSFLAPLKKRIDSKASIDKTLLGRTVLTMAGGQKG